jgi:hypothetical protein
MLTRTTFSLLVAALVATQTLAFHIEAAPASQSPWSGIGAAWRSEPFNLIETTPAERQRIAAGLGAAPVDGIAAQVQPEATFSDSANDLLFRWLSPEDADYALSIEGATVRSTTPLAALGFTSPSFYWSAVTFNRYDPNLAAYDWVPDYGTNWWNGLSSASYSDGANSTVPAFADLRTIGITRSGADTQWVLTSAGALPSLPAAYQLGYNFNVESGGQRLQQFIGATAFTPSGWYWAIHDRGNLFPGWNSNLDVTEVIVAQPTPDTVQFEAKVAGTLRSTYASSDAWPRFYWYLDKDNNTATGDNFTFGYQDGGYVFTYVLNGIDSVVEVLYDETSSRWLAILTAKTGPGIWEPVADATPVLLENNRIRVIFSRADTGVYSTFRWGLVNWFRMSRGGQFYTGNVDVAPNAGMQTQTLTVDPNQALAEQYAPVLYQANTVEYYPVSIDYTLDHATLHCGVVIKEEPKLDDLAKCSDSNGYLNLNGTNAGETWDEWYASSGRDQVIYASVYSAGSTTVIQYWLHYYSSDWARTKGCYMPGWLQCLNPFFRGNNHEGDWEMVEVILEYGSPRYAAYSQHHGGTRRLWDYVEKYNSKPVVYIGWGSHASYFKSADYYPKHELALGLDITSPTADVTNRRNIIVPSVVLLPSASEPGWLNFKGKWGGDNDSPRGPRWSDPANTDPTKRERESWRDPLAWGRNSAWDEEGNYGGCLDHNLDVYRGRAWRMCISGVLGRLFKPVVYDAANSVLISPDINRLDPSRRDAEYLLNCQNNATQNILIYRVGSTPAAAKLELSPRSDPCPANITQASIEASNTLTVTVTIPDIALGQIRGADFTHVTVTPTTVARLALNTPNLQLQLDHNNDGMVDETRAPDRLVQQSADFVSPATTSNLSVGQSGPYAELRWTAPGNNGTTGQANYYDIRYATFPLTPETWDYALAVPHGLAPSPAGTAESLRLDALPPGRYYFAIRTFDQDYNASEISNTVPGNVFANLFLPLIRR